MEQSNKINEMARVKQLIEYNLKSVKLASKLNDEQNMSKVVFNSPLNGIKGLGEGTIRKLASIGIHTTDDLKAVTEENLFKTITNEISRIQIREFLAGKPSSILAEKEEDEKVEEVVEDEEVIAEDEKVEDKEGKGLLNKLFN